MRWTQRALGDLREILDFITRDSLHAAAALIERLLPATERLAALPQSGRARISCACPC